MMCTDLDHPRSFGVVMYMIGYELSFSLSVDLQLPSMQKYTFPTNLVFLDDQLPNRSNESLSPRWHLFDSKYSNNNHILKQNNN